VKSCEGTFAGNKPEMARLRNILSIRHLRKPHFQEASSAVQNSLYRTAKEAFSACDMVHFGT